MSVFTQVAAALAWPVSRIKRRGTGEEDPLQSDGETTESRRNGSDMGGGRAESSNSASSPGTFDQANAASSPAAGGGAGPAHEAAVPGQPSIPAPAPDASAIPPPKGETPKDDILTLFTEDMAGNEDMERLTPFLKDVDVYDLADECRSVAAALQKQR